MGASNLQHDGSESSDPDQDLLSEPHEGFVSDEQEVRKRSFEDISIGDIRTKENERSEQNMRDVNLELGYREDYETKQCMAQEKATSREAERR